MSKVLGILLYLKAADRVRPWYEIRDTIRCILSFPL